MSKWNGGSTPPFIANSPVFQDPGSVFRRGEGGILPERGSAQQRDLVSALVQSGMKSAGASGSPLLALLAPMVGGAVVNRADGLYESKIDSIMDGMNLSAAERALLDTMTVDQKQSYLMKNAGRTRGGGGGGSMAPGAAMPKADPYDSILADLIRPGDTGRQSSAQPMVPRPSVPLSFGTSITEPVSGGAGSDSVQGGAGADNLLDALTMGASVPATEAALGASAPIRTPQQPPALALPQAPPPPEVSPAEQMTQRVQQIDQAIQRLAVSPMARTTDGRRQMDALQDARENLIGRLEGMEPDGGNMFRAATEEEAALYGARSGQFGPDGRFYATGSGADSGNSDAAMLRQMNEMRQMVSRAVGDLETTGLTRREAMVELLRDPVYGQVMRDLGITERDLPPAPALTSSENQNSGGFWSRIFGGGQGAPAPTGAAPAGAPPPPPGFTEDF